MMLIALLFSLTIQSSAQNLQRMSIEREDAGTGIPVFTEHPDKAGIVIESSVSGLRFSSNMRGIVEVKEPASGRYVLIIEPFTQIIRVDAENFVQERFRVGNPQARDVFYFSVAPEQRQSDLISVIFNVEPEDARLFLNGQQVETNATLQLPTQGYELRLEREGYRSINEVVNVSPDNIQFNYSMEEIDIVPVRIRSNVEGARVIIDGTERGEVDRSGTFGIFLFPGTYNFSLQSPGFVSVNEVLDVGETSDNEFDMNMTENIGFLQVSASPANATVRVNGEQQTFGENGQISLSPGSYDLEIISDGYLSYQDEVVIDLGETVQRNVELVRNAGTLRFDITPADATLEINRQSYNPVQQVELTPDRYRIEVFKEGFERYSENIDVQRGDIIEREITLEMQTGALQFTVVPGNAEVILENVQGNEVDRWEGLNFVRNLQVGAYTLNVNADGHLPQQLQIIIIEDETLQIRLELSEGEEPKEIGDVYNPATGRTWMDRNLGASRPAISPTDAQAYGDLYQWGRPADGHEDRNSSTITTLSRTDQPGHANFIIALYFRYDWRKQQNDNLWQGLNGINNPCPLGYRLPTETEWEAERNSWDSNNKAGAFNSLLKLPVAGYRSNNGSIFDAGSQGRYWSSSVSSAYTQILLLDNSFSNISTNIRANGASVRCIKN